MHEHQAERHYAERIGCCVPRFWAQMTALSRRQALWLELPLLIVLVSPPATMIPLVAGSSLMFLALMGGLAARVGGANVAVGAVRVTFWGALAMVATAAVGAMFGSVV